MADADHKTPIRIARRNPDKVMRLKRLGSLHQCRLSFMRTLLRRLRDENWRFERLRFDFDVRGEGTAVYAAIGPERTYSLVCFGHDLPAEQRSDRVIAEAWDSTFTLFDGVPDDADIERLRANVPKQEAGRISGKELSLSRANRSVRLFDAVVSALANGRQPDREEIEAVGYLMRTTAVYGSGKFGAADRQAIEDRPECRGPFQIEMLSVYLTRTYVMDLVEHMARLRAPEKAVVLEPELRRAFGVGNSTGLGMAPFIINHPKLFNNWIAAREEALARVRSLPGASEGERSDFLENLKRAGRMVAHWQSGHPLQLEKIADLKQDLRLLDAHLADEAVLDADYPWDALHVWAEEVLSLEGQELLVSLMMEPYGHLIDELTGTMAADEGGSTVLNGAMSIGHLRGLISEFYGWALAVDWEDRGAIARVWYTSEEKLEPRLGERFEEPIEAYEQPLAPGRDVARLMTALEAWDYGETVAAFLLSHPEHRHSVRRVQLAETHVYAEIRDNTISADLLPIDLLRCKLSFFGAIHFDPRSDRWVRINMFKSAPFPHELQALGADDWSYSA